MIENAKPKKKRTDNKAHKGKTWLPATKLDRHPLRGFLSRNKHLDSIIAQEIHTVDGEKMSLLKAAKKGKLSLDGLILFRKSIKDFTPHEAANVRALIIEDIGNLLSEPIEGELVDYLEPIIGYMKNAKLVLSEDGLYQVQGEDGFKTVPVPIKNVALRGWEWIREQMKKVQRGEIE